MGCLYHSSHYIKHKIIPLLSVVMVITMAVATVERLRDCEEGQLVMQLSGVVVNLFLLSLVLGWSPGWFQFLEFSNSSCFIMIGLWRDKLSPK